MHFKKCISTKIEEFNIERQKTWFLEYLSLVFTSDRIGVGVVIRSIELYDLVKIASWFFCLHLRLRRRSRKQKRKNYSCPIPKLTIVLIWKTPACLKFGKTSNCAVENLLQRKLWVWAANDANLPVFLFDLFVAQCTLVKSNALW